MVRNSAKARLCAGRCLLCSIAANLCLLGLCGAPLQAQDRPAESGVPAKAPEPGRSEGDPAPFEWQIVTPAEGPYVGVSAIFMRANRAIQELEAALGRGECERVRQLADQVHHELDGFVSEQFLRQTEADENNPALLWREVAERRISRQRAAERLAHLNEVLAKPCPPPGVIPQPSARPPVPALQTANAPADAEWDDSSTDSREEQLEYLAARNPQFQAARARFWNPPGRCDQVAFGRLRIAYLAELGAAISVLERQSRSDGDPLFRALLQEETEVQGVPLPDCAPERPILTPVSQPAPAPPQQPAVAAVPPGQNDDQLGTEWSESESGWSGRWIRRGSSNTFDANWNRGGEEEVKATLTINIAGNRVTVERVNATDGNSCQYEGTLSGSSVSGTYRCTSSGAGRWSATIRNERVQVAAAAPPPRPSPAVAPPTNPAIPPNRAEGPRCEGFVGTWRPDSGFDGRIAFFEGKYVDEGPARMGLVEDGFIRGISGGQQPHRFIGRLSGGRYRGRWLPDGSPEGTVDIQLAEDARSYAGAITRADGTIYPIRGTCQPMASVDVNSERMRWYNAERRNPALQPTNND